MLNRAQGSSVFFDKAGETTLIIFSQFVRKLVTAPEICRVFHVGPLEPAVRGSGREVPCYMAGNTVLRLLGGETGVMWMRLLRWILRRWYMSRCGRYIVSRVHLIVEGEEAQSPHQDTLGRHDRNRVLGPPHAKHVLTPRIVGACTSTTRYSTSWAKSR